MILNLSGRESYHLSRVEMGKLQTNLERITRKGNVKGNALSVLPSGIYILRPRLDRESPAAPLSLRLKPEVIRQKKLRTLFHVDHVSSGICRYGCLEVEDNELSSSLYPIHGFVDILRTQIRDLIPRVR